MDGQKRPQGKAKKKRFIFLKTKSESVKLISKNALRRVSILIKFSGTGCSGKKGRQ
jgi:hypothetical protein